MLTRKRRLKPSDWFRNLVLSWLFAAVIEYLLLPASLRSLDTLNLLTSMSIVRMIVCTCCLLCCTSGLSYLFCEHKHMRTMLLTAFTVLAISALHSSFQWAFLGGCTFIVLHLVFFRIYGWNDSPEPIPNTQSDKRIFVWITLFFTLLLFLFISLWTVSRVCSFSTPTYDFGIFSQMFYYMHTKGTPLTTLERDGLLSHFAVHVSPVYYLMLPFYICLPTPATLQVLQAAVLASSVIPLWLIGKQYGLSSPLRMLLCICALLYPALSGGAGYDIHENCFLTPLLLWLLYALKARRILLIPLTAILALTVKEDAAVYVAIIGAYQTADAFIHTRSTRRQDLITGICLLSAAVIWFILVTAYLSQYGDGVMSYRYENFIPKGSSSLTQVIITVLLCPMKALYECLDADKLPFLAQTLFPLLGIPLFTRRYERYILLIPYLLINLMPDYLYQHDIFFQYTFGSTALLLYLTCANVADWKCDRTKLLGFLAMILTCSIFFFTLVCPVAVRYVRYSIQYQSHYQQIRDTLLGIPDDASVCASTFYTTQLSQREILYDLGYCSRDHLLESEFVVINVGEPNISEITTVLKDHGYTLYAQLPCVLMIYQSPER